MLPRSLSIVLLVAASALACRSASSPGSGDAAFARLAEDVLAENYRRNPTNATYLGIHDYDDRLEDLSASAIAAAVARAKEFGRRLAALDPATLSAGARLDHEFLGRQLEAEILQLDVIRGWARDPDSYSSAITNSAYILMKRSFAPPEARLRLLVAREKQMPALLAEARKNLRTPPKILTEIAIEQIDGNRAFFEKDLTLAFAGVADAALQAEFQRSNAAVLVALADYKVWLEKELLPRSTGSYALGAETYAKLLAATEMVEVPLERLLGLAEADRAKNEAQLVATAKAIDPSKSADQVLLEVEADHPEPAALLATTQATLDSLRVFIEAKKIVTIPVSAPARVQETPPFMRSTTSASMDTPGPFETKATEAFYNMTLPDPRWSSAEQQDFMRQWYYASICNVSVHEVYPGHYLQFLYAKQFPTDVRKVFGANTNSEGWAHYAEQMMLDEGFHAGEPRFRLAQLQDALLRDVRFIVGIKLHTQGLTIEEAQRLFETEAHQPAPVALSEAKRGANDPLYGYYTMGKLAILKLRDDYEAKKGAAFTLQEFHDALVRLGPLPLPLVREALLGERGSLF
jgi:uncharacterized protein (DUF885 family)